MEKLHIIGHSSGETAINKDLSEGYSIKSTLVLPETEDTYAIVHYVLEKVDKPSETTNEQPNQFTKDELEFLYNVCERAFRGFEPLVFDQKLEKSIMKKLIGTTEKPNKKWKYCNCDVIHDINNCTGSSKCLLDALG